MSNDSFPGSVVLVGQFDPEMVARYLPSDIAQPISSLKSNPGVPVHSLAQGLSARGISTTLIGGVRGAAALHIQNHPLSVAIYPKRGGLPFVLNGLARERRYVLDLLGKVQPSIVHAHWTFEGARAVADWAGPKVLTVHDAGWEYARLGASLHPTSLAYTARWLYNTAQILKRFHHIIAVSPFVETYLRLIHRYRGEIRVIPNVVPELVLQPSASRPYPKSGTLTFGCYGEPGGIKNVKAAIAAFRRLPKPFSQARLLVFGAQRKTAHGSNERIAFRGSLSHSDFLQALADEVDIWVHPARVEAHPLSICEAIQTGCPVIAGGASGGVAWTLDYGRIGVLVDVEDPEAIKRAMVTLASDPEKAQLLVQRGQRFIREQFNRERVIDLHLQFYRDILSG